MTQATLTLKATIQILKRSSLMPLSRGYRADRIFGVKQLNCMMVTDTLDARVKSIHGQQYCQLFGNKYFFVEAYLVEKRSGCHESLERFVRGYRASDVMQCDSAPEQVGPHTKFQANMRKYGIKGHTNEKKRSNHKPAEGVIRELIKKCYREMFCTYIPRGLWRYRYPYVAKIMQLTASTSGKFQRRAPFELLTRETPTFPST